MSDRTADRPLPGDRSSYAAFVPITTRWSDNDVYGHMNNVVHYSLFDTAVNSWLIEKGILRLQGSDIAFLVVETGCRYFAELAFPDRIAAGLRIARLGSSSIRYEVGLFRGEDKQAAAEGDFVHVQVDRQSRRPRPLDAPQRAVFEELMR